MCYEALVLWGSTQNTYDMNFFFKCVPRVMLTWRRYTGGMGRRHTGGMGRRYIGGMGGGIQVDGEEAGST